MGVEGLDEKYARGKYPREAWPWDRADPHADAVNHDWAKPEQWDGMAEYDGIGKLNTSIYELYVFGGDHHLCIHASSLCTPSLSPVPAHNPTYGKKLKFACSVIGQQFGEHWWPIANFEFPNFLHYYRASLVKLCAPSFSVWWAMS